MATARIFLRNLSAALAIACIAVPMTAKAEPTAAKPYEPVHVAEANSKELCESRPHRLFVPEATGSECVAYWVTPGNEDRRQAVIFMGGDYSPEQYTNPTFAKRSLAARMRTLGTWAKKFNVRYINIARLGLQGSSGDHSLRRRPHETLVMNAAITLLKQRLGFDTFALAGQSGGSNIAASLQTLGRRDIACNVLGSGALSLVDTEVAQAAKRGRILSKVALSKVMYDPSTHISTVARAADRRIFGIGDPNDQQVPFQFQKPFIDLLSQAGHRAMMIKVEGRGDVHHDTTPYTYPVAGACLNGFTDDQIVSSVSRVQAMLDKQEKAQADRVAQAKTESVTLGAGE